MRARIILVLSIITIIISLQLFADTEPMGAAMRYRAGKNDLELYIGGLTAIDEKHPIIQSRITFCLIFLNSRLPLV